MKWWYSAIPNLPVAKARDTGRLAFTGLYTPVGNPSMIVFLDLAKAG